MNDNKEKTQYVIATSGLPKKFPNATPATFYDKMIGIKRQIKEQKRHQSSGVCVCVRHSVNLLLLSHFGLLLQYGRMFGVFFYERT